MDHTCPECNGQGKEWDGHRTSYCDECNGSGKLDEDAYVRWKEHYRRAAVDEFRKFMRNHRGVMRREDYMAVLDAVVIKDVHDT